MRDVPTHVGLLKDVSRLSRTLVKHAQNVACHLKGGSPALAKRLSRKARPSERNCAHGGYSTWLLVKGLENAWEHDMAAIRILTPFWHGRASGRVELLILLRLLPIGSYYWNVHR